MSKNTDIGIDSMRLWAADEAQKIRDFLRKYDDDLYNTMKNKLIARMEAFEEMDEQSFNNWTSRKHYVNKAKKYYESMYGESK